MTLPGGGSEEEWHQHFDTGRKIREFAAIPAQRLYGASAEESHHKDEKQQQSKMPCHQENAEPSDQFKGIMRANYVIEQQSARDHVFHGALAHAREMPVMDKIARFAHHEKQDAQPGDTIHGGDRLAIQITDHARQQRIERCDHNDSRYRYRPGIPMHE